MYAGAKAGGVVEACAAVVLLVALGTGPVRAQAFEAPLQQDTARTARWVVHVDGRRSELAPRPAHSLEAAAREVLRGLQREGYYLARLDSTVTEPPRLGRDGVVRLYVRRGPEVRLGQLVVRGTDHLSAAEVRAEFQTSVGGPLDPDRLEADIGRLLDRYEAEGFPLAQVFVDDVRLVPGPEPTLTLVVRVDEGPPLTLHGVELDGAVRTRAAYVRRVTGLRLGQRLTSYGPEDVRRQLAATGLYREVGMPVLETRADSAVIRIPVTEEPPGVFDLVVGYLPPQGGGRGRVVGSGHLVLRNVLGAGRLASLRLERQPGPSSRLHLQASDPYLLGWPLGAEVSFEGVQQDSTYDLQRYRLVLGYRLGDDMELTATAERQRAQPGGTGTSDRSAVPRSSAWFGGFGLRLDAVDDPFNPRRGVRAEVVAERGRKQRRRPEGEEAPGEDLLEPPAGVPAEEQVAGDGAGTVLRQERLTGSARLYVPVRRRQVAVLGGEGALLLSDVYDASELFRVGGARSLRGYDEDRFRARAYARVLGEYRLQVDARSYAYLFADLGYVDVPRGEERAARRGWYPGYGLGLQVSTQLGLVNVSYAVNPEDGILGGRLHLGLTVGL